MIKLELMSTQNCVYVHNNSNYLYHCALRAHVLVLHALVKKHGRTENHLGLLSQTGFRLRQDYALVKLK